MNNWKKIKVTFRTKTGHEVVEVMDKSKGSNLDYKLRALALGWTVVCVEVKA